MTALTILIRRWPVYKKRKHPNFFNRCRNVQLVFSFLNVTSHALCTTISNLLYIWCGASMTIISQSNVNWSAIFYNLHLIWSLRYKIPLLWRPPWRRKCVLLSIFKMETYDIKALAICDVRNSRNAFRNTWHEGCISYVCIVECYSNQNHITWQCNFFQVQCL